MPPYSLCLNNIHPTSVGERGQGPCHRGWTRYREARLVFVTPDTYPGLAGAVEGGVAGQGAWTFPAGHRPELGHIPCGRQKICLGVQPPTKQLSVKDRAKAEALAQLLMTAD